MTKKTNSKNLNTSTLILSIENVQIHIKDVTCTQIKKYQLNDNINSHVLLCPIFMN